MGKSPKKYSGSSHSYIICDFFLLILCLFLYDCRKKIKKKHLDLGVGTFRCQSQSPRPNLNPNTKPKAKIQNRMVRK